LIPHQIVPSVAFPLIYAPPLLVSCALVSLRRSVASAQAAKAKNPPGLSPGGFPLALARDLRRPRVGQGLGSTSARMEPGLGPHLVGGLAEGQRGKRDSSRSR